MSWLFVLWLVSLALAVLAFLTMVGLISVRAVNARRDRICEGERGKLVPLLLEAEQSDSSLIDMQRAPDMITDLTMELVQMVRGPEQQRFIANAFRFGVPERLRRRMRLRSPRTRLAAAEALGLFGDTSSIARLRDVLDDSNAGVRLAAAIALAPSVEAPPVRVLIDKLGIGTRENSMLVVGLFRDIANQRPEEILALIEDNSTVPAVRMAAVDALCVSGDYTLVPVVAKLAINADPGSEELPRYLHALGKFGHPAGAEAVAYGLGCEAWEARSAAAQAAGRIGLDESGERLAALLEDPQWWVRFRAGEALIALGENGRRLLEETAGNGCELAKTASKLILAEHSVSP